ncbi:uncharacterized protein LOC131994124 [Stomoxys calcitrans]|uniref:uncharacterized protein LOC131994124 n=1 Tax=Stomoxys calcitrans TaxID=35570 RepID=UPI0027E25C91|nr:uncharacterized protein LOC131994124 [Stomoxys calcitrans]
MRQFSIECGAEMPKTLRGTMLRKHIATYTSILNIGEASVDTLANFLGHHKDIHKNHYRLPVPVAEITTVSKLLESAAGYDEQQDDEDDDEGDEDQVDDGDSGEDSGDDGDGENNDEREDVEGGAMDNNLESEYEEENKTQPTKRKRNTSPYGKTKRTRWTFHEMEEELGEITFIEKLPSLKACQSAINKYGSLRHRSPQQLKSWLQNKMRQKKNLINSFLKICLF